MSEVEDFTAEHADLRAELNVDYETWLVEDRLVSIKFIILVNMPGYAHPEVTVETFVYDLETVQPVFLEDILVEGSLPKLAQLARDDLASNPDYAGYVDLDLFTTGTEPVYDNYRRFLLTQDHFTLLFQKYQVFPGAVGTPSVAIPYGRMEGIIDLPGPDSQAPQDPPNAMDYPRREPPPDIDGNCGPGSAGGHGIGEEAVRQIDPDKPMVALTFDDGPLSSTTGSILDTLKEHDSVATFFVIGNRAHHNAELLKRMVSEGHEIGNHSFNHKRLTTLSPEELQYQIERTQIAVKTVTGVEPLIMRPTYGSYNNQLEQNAGMPMIMWSVDTRDWESRDVESIIQQVMDHVQDGDIILMHDIYVPTAEAVKAVVPELISRGFQLVTVSELLAAKGISLEAGKVYRNGGNLQY
jgi:peptidoglycan/xylan/chitin deacetylase (PgdA/CDA1 family)